MKNINSHIHETQVMRDFVPLMRYDGKEAFDTWQKRAREKLRELLGLPFEKCDSEFEIEYQKEFDTHTEYRFIVQTEKGYYVPAHLIKPKRTEGRIPLTICLSGHGGGMHVALGKAKTEDDEKALSSWHHRAMGPRSVREGRCALVIEARNFGESSLEGYGTSCTEASKIAIIMGRSVIGERVWDVSRILDAVFDEFDFIDEDDVVCTGNSGGGTATYYLSCLDERIKVSAPSCSVCEFEDSIGAMPHCLCNHVPSIRRYFEMGDMAGLIAPRRLIIAAGKEDSIFPINGVQRSYEMVKRMYKAAGTPEKCSLVVGDGGHLNYADLIWKEYYKKETQ